MMLLDRGAKMPSVRPVAGRVGVVGRPSTTSRAGWRRWKAFRTSRDRGPDDPDPERGRTLAPLHHDPSLRRALGEAYRDVPFETSLERLIADHDLDLALVTLPNADAPAAIAASGRGRHPPHRRQAGRPVRDKLRPPAAAVQAAG